MPNYQKISNKLFASGEASPVDNSTGKLRVIKQRGQTFVAVPDKNAVDAPKCALAKRALQSVQTHEQPQPAHEEAAGAEQRKENQNGHTKSLPSIKTKKAIRIVKKVNHRAVDGVMSSYDSSFKGTFQQPKFYEQVEDPKRPKHRNASHITHSFTVADGLAGDIWESSYGRAYGAIPSSYPPGFVTNQGIASMYSHYTKTGKLDGGCSKKRINNKSQ